MRSKNKIALLFHWSSSFIKPFFPVLLLLLFFSLVGNYVSTFEPVFTGKIKPRTSAWHLVYFCGLRVAEPEPR